MLLSKPLVCSVLFTIAIAGHTAAKPPNIIILYADDLGYGDVSCQNPNSKIPTPHIDRLASEGMRFTDAHSSSGICTPSRYALLTGRYHWRDFHGIVGDMEHTSVFKPEQLTLPMMLKQRGYDTAAIGKWHLGWDYKSLLKTDAQKTTHVDGKKFYGHEAFDWRQPIPGGPLSVGFDHYFGDDVINFPPYAWIIDDRIQGTPTTNMSVPESARMEGRWETRPGPSVEDWDFFAVLPTLTDYAVDYVSQRKNQAKPFFLYLAYPSPHAPIIPNDAYIGQSQAGLYGDFVYQTDDAVGRILHALDQAGLADHTLLIFSSDNGPEKYAYKRTQTHNHWSAAPLRGLKRDLYEGGHRVPFVVRWPDHVPAGTVNHQLLHQVDVMQTLATITGAALPDKSAEDSFDFAHNWQQAPDQQTRAIRGSAVHNTRRNAYAIRQGDWLLIDHKTGHHANGHTDLPEEDPRGQLFDLSQDLAQRRNLIDQYPDRVQTMKRLLQAIRERGHSAPRLADE